MKAKIKRHLKEIVYNLSRNKLAKINKFYNTCHGEDCYIFADGISIKSMDIKAFSDKQSIACNFFPFHNEFQNLNCQYCIVAEPWQFSPFAGYRPMERDFLIATSNEYKILIDKYVGKNFFIHLSNYPFMRADNVFYMLKDIPDNNLEENFITRRIDCFAGVARASILLAIYLGFDRAFLVGFDYTHSPSRSHHWYEKGHGVIKEPLEYQKEFFDIAKEFIDICTITLDGASPYITSITYKEHTKIEPIYRENTALIQEKYLKALSIWPKYRIY